MREGAVWLCVLTCMALEMGLMLGSLTPLAATWLQTGWGVFSGL